MPTKKRSKGAEQRATNPPSPYSTWTREQLWTLLRGRSLPARTSWHKQTLIDAVEEAENGATTCSLYNDWTAEDLLHMAKNRGIRGMNSPTPNNHLIASLEYADANARFPIMRLPIELRNMIYAFAMLQQRPIRRLPDKPTQTYYQYGLFSEVEPDLCKVEVLRQESLTQYISIRRFSLLAWKVCLCQFVEGKMPTPRWMKEISEEDLALIRLLRVEVYSRDTSNKRRNFCLCIDLLCEAASYKMTLLEGLPVSRYRETVRVEDWTEVDESHIADPFARQNFLKVRSRLEAELTILCREPGVGRFGTEEFKRLAFAVGKPSAN